MHYRTSTQTATGWVVPRRSGVEIVEVDYAAREDFRAVQLTTPGSAEGLSGEQGWRGLERGRFGHPGESFGQILSAAGAAATGAQIAQAIASYERREEEWRRQRGIAGKDVEIGDQQILLAPNQHQLAVRSRAWPGSRRPTPRSLRRSWPPGSPRRSCSSG
jgi:hypothetical protein